MNSTVVTAMAAALGSLVGPLLPLLRLGSHSARRPFVLIRNGSCARAVLYKKFITEASRLAVDALAHSLEGTDKLMALYGILSCIRLMSGEEVVRQGEACCRRIIKLYGRPNLTTDQIRAAAEAHGLDDIDPLEDFSTACRNELLPRQW